MNSAQIDPKSESVLSTAANLHPTGPSSLGMSQRYSAALMNTFGLPSLTLARGHGSTVWDVDGKEYLDLFGGIAVAALGHAHPALVEAVTSQLKTLGHVSNFFATEPQIRLAERLAGTLDGQARVFFTNSGTEANEAAFKATRKTGRRHLVAATGAFHGRSLGALALTAKPDYRTPFEPLPGDVTFVEYGDTDALAAAVNDQTAAIVLEPIQGEAGVIIPPRDYLAQARSLADKSGALLWLDEVQTGNGRTGTWWAHQNTALFDPVRPDLVTTAKGLGGGLPIGACVGLRDAGLLLEAGSHGSTFGGNPVACAAALAVLDVIQNQGLLDQATQLGSWFAQQLRHQPGVTEVDQAGLLLGVQLSAECGPTPAPQFVSAARQLGFLVNATGAHRLRLAPALIIDKSELATFVKAWPTIMSAVVP
jgi:acetylornithine/N-succinyldiaminopimelate aminotransferase